MPNWCYNEINITGNPNLIKKLKEFVGRPITRKGEEVAEPIYSLANIVPSVPDSKSFLGEKFESSGQDDWYHNNINSWGTKWDVAGSDVSMSYQEGSDSIGYGFDSAWSPPTLTTERLTEIFPELTIEHKYYEGGMGFWGIHTYKGGEQITEEGGELDHTAWVALGMECYQCEQYEQDPDEYEEYLYSDCPPAIELAKAKAKETA
jgi:hypothetical protein